MITFLWMLYLAFTIYCTIKLITYFKFIHNAVYNEFSSIVVNLAVFIVALLWSIWYFYYLN